MTPCYLLEPGKEEGDDDALQKIFCKQITRQLVTLKVILYLFLFCFFNLEVNFLLRRKTNFNSVTATFFLGMIPVCTCKMTFSCPRVIFIALLEKSSKLIICHFTPKRPVLTYTYYYICDVPVKA